MWPFNCGKKRYHEIESIERKKGGGRKRLSTAGDDRLSTKLCLKDRKASSTDLKQDWEKYTGVRTSGTTVRRRLLTQGLGTGGVCQLKPQLIMLSHFVRWPLQCLKSPYMISHLLISCLLTNLVLQLLDCCVYDYTPMCAWQHHCLTMSTQSCQPDLRFKILYQRRPHSLSLRVISGRSSWCQRLTPCCRLDFRGRHSRKKLRGW